MAFCLGHCGQSPHRIIKRVPVGAFALEQGFKRWHQFVIGRLRRKTRVVRIRGPWVVAGVAAPAFPQVGILVLELLHHGRFCRPARSRAVCRCGRLVDPAQALTRGNRQGTELLAPRVEHGVVAARLVGAGRRQPARPTELLHGRGK